MNGTADPLFFMRGKMAKDKHRRGKALSTPDSVA